MNQQAQMYGIIGGAIGLVLGVLIASYSVNNNMAGMMRMMGMRSNMMDAMMDEHGGGMTMDEMAESLQDKRGDDFDKAFIAAMIDHHQGAIDMAELAKRYAKHDEIRKMADDIISTQAREIEQMRQWEREWGY